MNILIVDENGKIPVKTYGGTQRVIWALGKELSAMGHRVTFLVAKGSKCNFAGIIERNPRRSLTSQIPPETDVIHFNGFVPENVNKPYIATVHWSESPYLDENSVFISKHHADKFGSNCFVYNGLDWDEYGPVQLNNKRSYFHFLGKAAWSVKNVRGAIAVTKKMPGEILRVLGGYRFNFKMGIRFTFHPRIRFHGMVGGLEKNNLLQGSKGLIFPVIWHEPFGLAVIESLYFGAPVFATPYGSLPELVNDEVGFLSSSAQELADHIKSASYQPKICHEYARDLFNSRLMAEKYLDKYEIVMSGAKLNETKPKLKNDILIPQWTN